MCVCARVHAHTSTTILYVVLGAPRFSPSLPLLKQLHWLPVSYRIDFKLSTLTYRALSTQPTYLASLLHLSNIPGSSDYQFHNLLCLKQNLTWVNVLSLSLRLGSGMISPSLFRKKLKTSIPNCVSTINVRLALILILTFARPCSRLCLMILFCCTTELRFLRI